MHTLHEGDCLDILPGIPDGSVDLVVTDPPYYNVMTNAYNDDGKGWDVQWDSLDCYIEWLDEVLAELHRVLKPTGSLYLFADALNSARVQLAVSERFRVLSHIVWDKRTTANIMGWRHQTYYSKVDERIIYADKGEGHTWHPSRDYRTVWSILCNPNSYLDGRVHPCQKPVSVLQIPIETSSDPGDVVLDPFMGSGATGVCALGMGRDFIGIEQDTEYYKIASERVETAARRARCSTTLEGWI